MKKKKRKLQNIKKRAETIHAQKRLDERYELSVNQREIAYLNNKISCGDRELILKRSLRVSIYIVNFKNKLIPVVFDWKRHNVITVLPQEYLEKNRLIISNIRNHILNYLNEKYGISIDEDHITALNNKVLNGDCFLISKKSLRYSIFLVVYKNRYIPLSFDWHRQIVGRILPPNYFNNILIAEIINGRATCLERITDNKKVWKILYQTNILTVIYCSNTNELVILSIEELLNNFYNISIDKEEIESLNNKIISGDCYLILKRAFNISIYLVHFKERDIPVSFNWNLKRIIRILSPFFLEKIKDIISKRRNHIINLLNERYGISIDERDIEHLNSKILFNDCALILKITSRVSIYEVNFKNKSVPVIFDFYRNNIVTILHPKYSKTHLQIINKINSNIKKSINEKYHISINDEDIDILNNKILDDDAYLIFNLSKNISNYLIYYKERFLCLTFNQNQKIIFSVLEPNFINNIISKKIKNKKFKCIEHITNKKRVYQFTFLNNRITIIYFLKTKEFVLFNIESQLDKFYNISINKEEIESLNNKIIAGDCQLVLLKHLNISIYIVHFKNKDIPVSFNWNQKMVIRILEPYFLEICNVLLH